MKERTLRTSTKDYHYYLFVKRAEVKYLMHPRYSRERYPKRRYYVEANEKGKYRICYQSWDIVDSKWTKPQCEKYCDFVAIVRPLRLTDSDVMPTTVKKIYINQHTHFSYILSYLEQYEFTEDQKEVLAKLILNRQ